ncbi:MAG: class I SAM-dependent methyltransferase [Candidatus Micrarchaeota archaeon]
MDLNKFFSKIAPKYDKLIEMLSMGLDKEIIKEAVKETEIGKGKKSILDVATGTGRIAYAIARSHTNYKVVGIDINNDMLSEAIKKSKGLPNLSYMLGDVELLNFENNSFDAVVTAFSLSVFNNLDNAISEMHRVLKPGGKLILLDMLKPKDSVLKKLTQLYYSVNIIPALDAKLKHDVEVYIRRGFSIDKDYIIRLIQQHGFKDIKERDLSGGLAFVVVAKK